MTDTYKASLVDVKITLSPTINFLIKVTFIITDNVMENKHFGNASNLDKLLFLRPYECLNLHDHCSSFSFLKTFCNKY